MKDRLDQYIDGVRHLPPTPTLMVKLLALFREPDVDIDEVVQLMSHDPSITAEVLKRCNSGYFGGSEPATDMFEAVTRLGFYEVYQIVVALFGARAMAAPDSGGGIEVAALWQHSVIVAVAAGVVAKELGEPEGIAFTAGLLHDVGKVVLASEEGAKYVTAVLQGGPAGLMLANAERALFGFDHTEVGARLLARWELPPDVIAAARHHHQLAGAEPYERFAANVQLANALAHRAEASPTPSPDGWQDVPEALAALRFTPEQAANLLEETRTGLERAKGLMSV